MIAIIPSSSDQTYKGPFAIQYHLRTSVLRRAFARAKRLLLADLCRSTPLVSTATEAGQFLWRRWAGG